MAQQNKPNKVVEIDGFTVEVRGNTGGYNPVSLTIKKDGEALSTVSVPWNVWAGHAYGDLYLPLAVDQVKQKMARDAADLAKRYGVTESATSNELLAALRSAGVSNQRIYSAMADANSGQSKVEVFSRAMELDKKARDNWVETSLRPWCDRHGLTIEQGLSVAFRDESFNPQDPENDLPTIKDVFAWNGQQNNFALSLMNELGMDSSTHPRETAQRERGG